MDLDISVSWALLHEFLSGSDSLDMSRALWSEVLVVLAWALSVSLLVLGDLFAELLVASLDGDSLPLLGVLSVSAWPEGKVNLILVLVVGGGQASLGLLVLNLLAVDDNWLGSILDVVGSHDHSGTWLDSLSGSV